MVKNRYHQIRLKPISIERTLKTDYFSYINICLIFIRSVARDILNFDDVTGTRTYSVWTYVGKQGSGGRFLLKFYHITDSYQKLPEESEKLGPQV